MISGSPVFRLHTYLSQIAISDHHYVSEDSVSPVDPEVRRKIVFYHNDFRTKVQPTSSNMLLMTWHSGAAKKAQAYAEKCIFLKHNDPKERSVPDLDTCGQNIFVSSAKKSWFSAINSWYLEHQNFTYGSPVRDFGAVGHYTQMVWATSHRVGCGVAHCDGGPWRQFYNFICHYCPGGNIAGKIEFPYKVGEPCGDCPNNCVNGGLCTNSCPVVDLYSNCDYLAKIPGYCSKGTCKASCECGNKKIYKNYPW
ncbi:serotriflin-like [Maniola jurtina]|uniref:serotriflin-like n=1 Tax=Maniola jurtina TaxID=191418 RepID=UPI001E68CC57|nr:serotriflin-like [Maniola jurtina]